MVKMPEELDLELVNQLPITDAEWPTRGLVIAIEPDFRGIHGRYDLMRILEYFLPEKTFRIYNLKKTWEKVAIARIA